jgi:arabinogalactan oligomer/maltooligosaccharide transport system permease protein
LAVALSVVPGLGQLYNGQWRKALFFLLTTVLTVVPAVFLITAGESWGHTLLGQHHLALFLLVAFGSVLLFLLLLVLGLFFWASAVTDARRTAMAQARGGSDDAARTWFFRL